MNALRDEDNGNLNDSVKQGDENRSTNPNENGSTNPNENGSTNPNENGSTNAKKITCKEIKSCNDCFDWIQQNKCLFAAIAFVGVLIVSVVPVLIEQLAFGDDDGDQGEKSNLCLIFYINFIFMV